ncbi:MAG: site-specific integrase, partial [Acidimicrobiia bacterium]|nr:site-specific integrase [Acidimicrobiia bacterium]
MATIAKVSTGWRARWRAPDGASRSKTFARRADAERHLTGVEHSKLMGSYTDPSAGRVSFRSYAESWRLVQPHRASTAISVEQDLRLHVYPTIGARAIAGIRTTEVQALVTALAGHLASSTVARVHGRVTSVFRAAVRDRVVAMTPCVDIRLPRAAWGTPVEEVLTTEQVLLLAEAVPPRYRALVLTGAGTGLRPGELFGLTADHLNFLRRTIRVDQQLVRSRGNGVGLGPLKTPSSYRTVPIPETVGEALAAHLATWPASGDGLVFTNEAGRPVQQHPFAVVWRRSGALAGLPSWA